MFQNDKQEIFNHKHKGNSGRRMGFILLICKLMHLTPALFISSTFCIECAMYNVHRIAVHGKFEKWPYKMKWNTIFDIRYSFSLITNARVINTNETSFLPPILNDYYYHHYFILFLPDIHLIRCLIHSALSPFNSNNVQLANSWLCVSIYFTW